MLQISSAKFYESDDLAKMYSTTHRGVLYTNYRFFGEEAMNAVGTLRPTAKAGELQTIVCEVTERLPKAEGGPYPGEVVSVAQDELIQDFAAVLSFGLNATCTPDHDLAHRLVAAQAPPLGARSIPKKYIEHMFDTSIPYRGDDMDRLRGLFRDLINLDRRSYVGAIRAIRRYVTAMHRVSDELDLSYALLVASIESLAQEHDNFIPKWEDFAKNKRKPIDVALEGASEDMRDRVRQAILDSEHVALKRRFSEFADRHLGPDFFRADARTRLVPVGRTELRLGLRNAYDLRSGYVHTLKPLPGNLVLMPTHADVLEAQSNIYLTHNGLARVARSIILGFIKHAPQTERETYNYRADFPNIMHARLAPQHWLHAAENYTVETARIFLNGFLIEFAGHIVDPTQQFSNLRAVARKIEALVPLKVKNGQKKLPMLALYSLFSELLPAEEQGQSIAFLQPYLPLFDEPGVDSLVVHFLAGEQAPQWALETSDQLLTEYSAQRFKKDGLNAGPLIGAALILWVAEMHRAAGNPLRARQLINDAVEEYPRLKVLAEFEAGPMGEMPQINWRKLLVPSTVPTKG